MCGWADESLAKIVAGAFAVVLSVLSDSLEHPHNSLLYPESIAKMVLKLYGSAMSFARVLVTILEKDLPYEHILVDIAKGDQKSEAYKKLQPFGKVPALDDDGFLIFESRAICKYLVRQVSHNRVSLGC